MSKFYAQLDANGRVHTVCQLKQEEKSGNLVEINELDSTLMGKKYDGRGFVEAEERVEEVTEEIETTTERLDRIEQKLDELIKSS